MFLNSNMGKRDTARTAVRRFLADESGQDVIEYALLTAVVGIAGILTWKSIADKAGLSYSYVDSNVQTLARPNNPL
jgi:Flp pilus assembly pilin Flp